MRLTTLTTVLIVGISCSIHGCTARPWKGNRDNPYVDVEHKTVPRKGHIRALQIADDDVRAGCSSPGSLLNEHLRPGCGRQPHHRPTLGTASMYHRPTVRAETHDHHEDFSASDREYKPIDYHESKTANVDHGPVSGRHDGRIVHSIVRTREGHPTGTRRLSRPLPTVTAAIPHDGNDKHVVFPTDSNHDSSSIHYSYIGEFPIGVHHRPTETGKIGFEPYLTAVPDEKRGEDHLRTFDNWNHQQTKREQTGTSVRPRPHHSHIPPPHRPTRATPPPSVHSTARTKRDADHVISPDDNDGDNDFTLGTGVGTSGLVPTVHVLDKTGSKIKPSPKLEDDPEPESISNIHWLERDEHEDGEITVEPDVSPEINTTLRSRSEPTSGTEQGNHIFVSNAHPEHRRSMKDSRGVVVPGVYICWGENYSGTCYWEPVTGRCQSVRPGGYGKGSFGIDHDIQCVAFLEPSCPIDYRDQHTETTLTFPGVKENISKECLKNAYGYPADGKCMKSFASFKCKGCDAAKSKCVNNQAQEMWDYGKDAVF